MKQLKQCLQRALCLPQSGGTGRGKLNSSPALGSWAAADSSHPIFGVLNREDNLGGTKKLGSGMARPLPGLPGKVLSASWIRGTGVEPTGRTCHAGVEELWQSQPFILWKAVAATGKIFQAGFLTLPRF